MTEMELKLILLRYNILSRERAIAACMWSRAGKSAYERDRWLKCVDEMVEISNDLRSRGYEFAYTGSKTTGEVQYDVYNICTRLYPRTIVS